jgi:hypothetical protein
MGRLAGRPPEHLAAHLWLAAALIVALLAVVGLAFLATRRRAARAAAALPALPAPPRPFPIPLLEPMPGVALGTTAPRGWQDAAVRGVWGNRSSGALRVTCVGVDLAGLWLPRPALRSIRVDERFATKFVPGTGLLVIGWEAAGRQYESGFRGTASGYQEVVAAVRGLLATGRPETSDRTG